MVKTAEEESRNSQNSPGTPLRLSTNMPPIRVGSVLGTTIIRTKSKAIEDTLDKEFIPEVPPTASQKEIPSTAYMSNQRTLAVLDY
jgi:hypothetical protein